MYILSRVAIRRLPFDDTSPVSITHSQNISRRLAIERANCVMDHDTKKVIMKDSAYYKKNL
ncbi:hypothetical protein VcTj87_15240 [Vibrio comitans]